MLVSRPIPCKNCINRANNSMRNDAKEGGWVSTRTVAGPGHETLFRICAIRNTGERRLFDVGACETDGWDSRPRGPDLIEERRSLFCHPIFPLSGLPAFCGPV